MEGEWSCTLNEHALSSEDEENRSEVDVKKEN